MKIIAAGGVGSGADLIPLKRIGVWGVVIGKALYEGAVTIKEALEIALGFEKESIIFFEEMKGMVPQSEQQMVTELINQEKEHLRKLYDLRETF